MGIRLLLSTVVGERAGRDRRKPLLTYVPAPFDLGPYGRVLEPKIEGQPGARVARWFDAPPTEEMLAAIRDDPLTAYHAPEEVVGQQGVINPRTEHGVILYPNFGSVDGTRKVYESLCNQYNNARRLPGYDPYRSAAEFQKQFVSAHAWNGDFHGRHSRILMNFALEQAGRPPSAIVEFDNDLLTSSSQWVDQVKAGSDRYGHWWAKLEQSGGNIDPVGLFDLGPMTQRYQQLGGEPSPFTPGKLHDVGRYERLHAQLHSET